MCVKLFAVHLWSAFQFVNGVNNGKTEVIDENKGSDNRIMISPSSESSYSPACKHSEG